MNKQLFIKEIELAAKKLGLTSSLGDDGRLQIAFLSSAEKRRLVR